MTPTPSSQCVVPMEEANGHAGRREGGGIAPGFDHLV
eukprot:CAMPEP_0177750814 /NCGR_PEP_ID=MMETSP0491_2-20121128/40_1 /TAXON_ID=63592 /ORGANISM="Tetraselmis chuii, Strain PLY429" /LENGTH=36 /DNA_ID= /DNA_START= /DNA_END= /DNA_ORIENTATION=